MFYSWLICNSSEIDKKRFPYLEKSVVLSNYFNQSYRLWKTENAITIYLIGQFVAVIPLETAGGYVNFGDKNYFMLIKKDDGTYDIIHGQNE